MDLRIAIGWEQRRKRVGFHLFAHPKVWGIRNNLALMRLAT